jgi:hypothetical protein
MDSCQEFKRPFGFGNVTVADTSGYHAIRTIRSRQSVVPALRARVHTGTQKDSLLRLQRRGSQRRGDLENWLAGVAHVNREMEVTYKEGYWFTVALPRDGAFRLH